MADMNEIYDALRKADAAGDTESVAKLSAYIQSQPAKQAMPNPDVSHAGIVGLGAGLGYGVGNVALGAQHYLGKGLEGIGLDQAGKWLVEDAASGRKKLESEVSPYKQVSPIMTGGGGIVGEIISTLPVGGIIAKPLMAGAKYAPQLGRIGQAIESAGFNVGEPAATMAEKVGNAALRVGGGATTGMAAGGLVNPGEGAVPGAIAGGAFGVASPLVGKVVNSVIGRGIRPSVTESQAFSSTTDNALSKAADDIGVDVKDLPDDTVRMIKDQVLKAFQQGKEIDPAALLRQEEFKKLGIQPLQSQITRDPTQFAQEFNLRGVSPEISGRLLEQNTALQSIFRNPAEQAQEVVPAGRGLIESLKVQDDAAKSKINELYKAAKDSSGRYAEVDVPAFSKAANDALDSEMLGRFLPDTVKNMLNDISTGKMPLNVNNLVQADSVMSAAQRQADDAGRKAIGVVRDALNNAPIASESGASAKQAFDVARVAAKERFAQQDVIPALKAVAQGDAVPDTFVKKFVLQGKTDEVKRLADMLRTSSPESFSQAKAQVADDIRRAAFGENTAGNAAVSPERLAKKLREFGSEKMSAFFTPEEIANYQTASRVAAYIAKHPNAAPVNTSNTLVAQLMTNPATMIAGKGAEMLPGAGVVISATKAATGAVKKQMAVSQAMNTNVPVKDIALTESQRRLLGKVLGGMGAGVSSQLAQ